MEGLPGFLPLSALYRFIDNKLSAVTVPDRHDLTWLNTMNWEDNCGQTIKEMKEAIKRAAHRWQEFNTTNVCVCMCLHTGVRVWCQARPISQKSSAMLGAAWWNHWTGGQSSWQGANHHPLFPALLCYIRSVMKATSMTSYSSLNCFHDWCWVRSAENHCLTQVISSLCLRTSVRCIIIVCFCESFRRNLSNVGSTWICYSPYSHNSHSPLMSHPGREAQMRYCCGSGCKLYKMQGIWQIIIISLLPDWFTIEKTMERENAEGHQAVFQGKTTNNN